MNIQLLSDCQQKSDLLFSDGSRLFFSFLSLLSLKRDLLFFLVIKSCIQEKMIQSFNTRGRWILSQSLENRMTSMEMTWFLNLLGEDKKKSYPQLCLQEVILLFNRKTKNQNENRNVRKTIRWKHETCVNRISRYFHVNIVTLLIIQDQWNEKQSNEIDSFFLCTFLFRIFHTIQKRK